MLLPTSSGCGEGMFRVGNFRTDESILSGSTQTDPKPFRALIYNLHCAKPSECASVKVGAFSKMSFNTFPVMG